MTGRLFEKSAALAGLVVLDMHGPRYPRFAQAPFRLDEPSAWAGRAGKPNPKAKKQAAAKRARKRTRRAT